MSAGALSYDAILAGLLRQNVPRERAEVVARLEAGMPLILPASTNLERLEKSVEHDGDKLMAAHGFEAIRFSQPRATKQTPGIPDRRYYRPARAETPAFSLWWEAKAADGVQSPAQRHFQELVESCGETYLLGTDHELLAWLSDNRLLR